MKRYETYKDSGIEWIGGIPEGWQVKKVKHECDVTDGTHFSPKTVHEGKPYITVSNVNKDTIDVAGALLISEEDFDLLVKQGCQPKVGDVLLAKDGTVGRTAIVGENNDFVCLSSLGILSPSKNLNSQYFKYSLDSMLMQDQMARAMAGSALRRITISKINELMFLLPSMEEQETIASYLDHKVGQIDMSISQIDSQIDSLKAYRQSVISEAVTKGLYKNARMKDSGIEWIGEIPEGWSVIPMKHYFYMKGRIGWQGLKADEFMEEGPYLVTGTDFKNGRVNWNTCYHITEERYQAAPEIHVHEGDVLITKDGTIGKLAYIEDKPEKVSLNSHLLILRPTKDVIDNYFVFWSLQSSAFKDYSGLASSGSTMASLSQEKIGSYFMALPPVDEQYVIAKYLENKTALIDEVINALDAQRTDLNALKQSIISEAVTGKIDVREWTPSVEQ